VHFSFSLNECAMFWRGHKVKSTGRMVVDIYDGARLPTSRLAMTLATPRKQNVPLCRAANGFSPNASLTDCSAQSAVSQVVGQRVQPVRCEELF
jgi:hypothetical protein